MSRGILGGSAGKMRKLLPSPGIGAAKSLIPFLAPHGQKCDAFGGGEQVFFGDFQVLRIDEVIDAEVLVRIEQEDFFVKHQQRAGQPKSSGFGHDEKINVAIRAHVVFGQGAGNEYAPHEGKLTDELCFLLGNGQDFVCAAVTIQSLLHPIFLVLGLEKRTKLKDNALIHQRLEGFENC